MSCANRNRGDAQGRGRAHGRGRGNGLADSTHATFNTDPKFYFNYNPNPSPQAAIFYPEQNPFHVTTDTNQPSDHVTGHADGSDWYLQQYLVAHEDHKELLRQIQVHQEEKARQRGKFEDLKAQVQSFEEKANDANQDVQNAVAELEKEKEESQEKDTESQQLEEKVQQLQEESIAAVANTAAVSEQKAVMKAKLEYTQEKLQKEKNKWEGRTIEIETLYTKLDKLHIFPSVRELIDCIYADMEEMAMREELELLLIAKQRAETLRNDLHEAHTTIQDPTFSFEQQVRISGEEKQILKKKLEECQEEKRQLDEKLRNQPDLKATFEAFGRQIDELNEKINKARHLRRAAKEMEKENKRLNESIEQIRGELLRKDNELGKCRDEIKY